MALRLKSLILKPYLSLQAQEHRISIHQRLSSDPPFVAFPWSCEDLSHHERLYSLLLHDCSYFLLTCQPSANSGHYYFKNRFSQSQPQMPSQMCIMTCVEMDTIQLVWLHPSNIRSYFSLY